MGVNFFSDQSQEAFGSFDRAFLSVFRLAAGETWVDTMEIINPDTGALNAPFAAFVMSYFIIVNCVLLQVRSPTAAWPVPARGRWRVSRHRRRAAAAADEPTP
jgi:hypothetical protein